MEHKFGKWEGKTDKQIKNLFPNEFYKRKINRWNYVVPNGESYALLKLRIKKFIKKNIKKNKNYIIFTHEMVSKVFRGIVLKMNNQETLHINQVIFGLLKIKSGTELDYQTYFKIILNFI